jgi:hypothetical protein
MSDETWIIIDHEKEEGASSFENCEEQKCFHFWLTCQTNVMC